MLIYWTALIIITLCCIAVAIYIFFSSNKLINSDDSFHENKNSDDNFDENKNITNMSKRDMKENLKELNIKMLHLEDASNSYISLIKRLQSRIEALENGEDLQQPKEDMKNVKDWGKLYLKEKAEKQKVEEQKTEEQYAEKKLNGLTSNVDDLTEMQSMLEARLSEAHSFQNKIGELQRALEGAAEREKDLQQELESTGGLYKEFTSLRQRYAHLQSENEDLRSRIAESNNRDIMLEQHMKHLADLESTFETIEYEKMEMKNTVDEIIAENTSLSLKLNALQDKLTIEKYVEQQPEHL